MAGTASPIPSEPTRRGNTATLCGRLRLSCLAVLALATAADGQPSGTAAVPGDDRSLSVGRWNVVSAVWDGTPVEQELLARLQVVFEADGSWVVLLRRLPVAAGTSRNREDASPKTFEMETLGSKGIEPSRYTGIYRLAGDTRELCMSPEGRPRPDEFAAPRHSGRMLVTLERVQTE